MGLGVRQLLFFFVLFVEAGSLGGVWNMGPHVPRHGAVSMDFVCFHFCILLPLFQVFLILAMAIHNLFPPSLTGAPALHAWFLAASLE